MLSEVLFWVELVMLAVLFCIGYLAIYTDIKFRIVPNIYVFGLLGLGLTGQLFMIGLEATSLGRVLTLIAVAFSLSYGLMAYGFWAPGDGKLYWASVLALPPTLCPSDDFSSLHAAPWALLLNSLVPLLVVLLILPFWRREGTAGSTMQRFYLRFADIMKAAVGIAALLGLILSFAYFVLDRPLSNLEAFGSLFIVYRLIVQSLKEHYWPILVFPGLLAFAYFSVTSGDLRPYGLLWLSALAAEMLFLHVSYWHRQAFVQTLPINLLQAGVVLRHAIFFEESEDKPVAHVNDKEERGECIYAAGDELSEADVYRLRALERTGAFPQGVVVEIEQSIPFVPFIVMGALLTALFPRNIVRFVAEIVGWV